MVAAVRQRTMQRRRSALTRWICFTLKREANSVERIVVPPNNGIKLTGRFPEIRCQ